EEIRPTFRHCTLAELAAVSVAAGIGEEMLFRGVLQALFTRWLGTWTGVVLASLLFGLLHPITALYVVLAAICGVYIGMCWIATDNLLVVMVAHALYDFIALTYLLKSKSPASVPQM